VALLAAILFGVWRWRRERQRNRYRREALAELVVIADQYRQDPANGGLQIAHLLKRTALAAYPRAQVASLHGPQWARFLCQSSGQDPQIVAAAEQLARLAYQPDLPMAELIAPTRRWIEAHHV